MLRLHFLFLFSFSLFVVQTVSAQQGQVIIQENLKWNNDLTEFQINENEEIKTLEFDGCIFNLQETSLPIFSKRIALNSFGIIESKLLKERYEEINISNADIREINEEASELIAISSKLTVERSKPFAQIELRPIRKNPFSGKLEKLVSFELAIAVSPSINTFLQKGNRSYTENSALNQGNHFKVGVSESGVYKITPDFLNDLGASGDISIDNLRVYGTEGGLLPELAGDPKTDDLAELAIQAVDNNNNGLFDGSDYLLFYGEGPDIWTLNNQGLIFEHQKHVYSDLNYYFVNFDIGQGRRIVFDAYNPISDKIISTFDSYYLHETEQVNLINGGRRWYGEEFGPNPNQTFTFQIPDLITSTLINARIRVAAKSNTFSSYFSIDANGVTTQTENMVRVLAGYEKPYAKSTVKQFEFNSDSETINIGLSYSKPDAGATAWLDFIELNAKRNLVYRNIQLPFRSTESIGSGNSTKFLIENLSPSCQVWEVSSILETRNKEIQAESSKFAISSSTPSLKEFIVFEPETCPSPSPIGAVPKQNLHANISPDLIIVSHPDFIASAEQLASYRRSADQLEVVVVSPEQIYNEFSGGKQDISAIRDFAKMYYDRADGDDSLMPKYLLFLGDASYDYKNIENSEANNHNFVPTFESQESIETINSYCTDDFFGFLDDTEGDEMNTQFISLDIAVGRLPVKSADEAQAVVDKIIYYSSNSTLGEWRNNFTFVADDEDGNLHLEHAESHSNIVKEGYPDYNLYKIYSDAYQQLSTTGGSRYPEVNEAINSKVFSGSLVVNYVGHGGENGWAHERILTSTSIQNWDNIDQMPLFVTATCSFSKYDNPEKTSAGEYLILNPNGGACAIVTTTRLVYASTNKTINAAFLNHLFEPINGEMPRIGEVTRLAKNDAASTKINNRKFALLGDPSMRLNYPQFKVKATEINNTSVELEVDTLKALSKVEVKGEVIDLVGAKIESFNGTVYPVVYDKLSQINTQKNDEDSDSTSFYFRKNIIFKGKASVTNGSFNFSFIVPKDIAYQFGTGRISFYAENGLADANGFSESLIIGGISEEADSDNTGPQVELYLNDESFVFGGLTDSEPVLIVKLKDENGINTVGNGIGHDITGNIDEETNSLLVLNEYYKAKLDSYQEGEVRYPLSELEPGLHSISVKAWDVFNNSGKGYTEFVVAESAEIALDHVLNYPNPFTDQTSFWFEHNQPGSNLTVNIQVMNLSGKVIKSIHQEVTGAESRVTSLIWDGKDDFGNSIGRGTYIYKLTVRTPDNSVAHKIEKLVLLK